jgi:excisionase family DNA binding protein
MERLLLNPSEVAEVLGIGRSRVYEFLAAGTLPSIRVGRSIRVPVEYLSEWIARRAADGGTAEGARMAEGAAPRRRQAEVRLPNPRSESRLPRQAGERRARSHKSGSGATS